MSTQQSAHALWQVLPIFIYPLLSVQIWFCMEKIWKISSFHKQFSRYKNVRLCFIKKGHFRKKIFSLNSRILIIIIRNLLGFFILTYSSFNSEIIFNFVILSNDLFNKCTNDRIYDISCGLTLLNRLYNLYVILMYKPLPSPGS